MRHLVVDRKQGTLIAKSTDAVLKKMRGLAATLIVLGVLFAMLVTVNPQVREHAMQIGADVRNQNWNSSAGPIGSFAQSAFSTTSYYASDNPILFSFVFVAVVLFLLMLRT